MSDLVLRENHTSAVHLILNRPDKLNSLNVPVFEALETHVASLAADRGGASVVVLRGAGRCFSAGHDLGDIAAGERLPRPNYQAKVIEALATLPMPVITAVHGHCYTGALELALAGDIILAAESAKFADTHARWALTPVWGLSQRLPRRIGGAKAREMMFTCRTYSGAQAQAMHLANFCFADDGFDAELAALAEDILANSWYANQVNKRALMASHGLTLHDAHALELFKNEGLAPDAEQRVAKFFDTHKKQST